MDWISFSVGAYAMGMFYTAFWVVEYGDSRNQLNNLLGVILWPIILYFIWKQKKR